MFRLIRDGSDTDSTLTDFTLTPGGRSPGTASTFSIPWAEDAIRQNKEDWERIERMMYCEEPLPVADENLRNELSEWMQAFPHLRVNGRSCQFHLNPALKPTDPEYEEIFAIHPSTEEEGQNIPIRTMDFDGLSISSQGFVEKVKTIEIDPNGRVTRNSVEYRKLGQSSRCLPDVGFVLRRSGTALSVSQLKPSRSATMRPSMSLPPITNAPALDGVVSRSISATVHSRKHTKRKSQLPSLRGEEEL